MICFLVREGGILWTKDEGNKGFEQRKEKHSQLGAAISFPQETAFSLVTMVQLLDCVVD